MIPIPTLNDPLLPGMTGMFYSGRVVAITNNFKSGKQIMDNTEDASIYAKHCTVNRIPNSWYFTVVLDNNKPDNVAITILAEVMRLHAIDGSYEFHFGYKYFQDNFNYSRYQIRNALVRLEKIGLIKRIYQTVLIHNRKFNNEMFLVLNQMKLNELQI